MFPFAQALNAAGKKQTLGECYIARDILIGGNEQAQLDGQHPGLPILRTIRDHVYR